MKKITSTLFAFTGACLILASTVLAQTSTTPPVPTPTAAPTVKPTPSPRFPDSATTPKLFKLNRHEGFMKRKTEGPIGLLFLGDSITDGWPSKGTSSWEKFAPYHPADFGISAIRTEGILWNITNGELDGLNPKATVLLIGVNNIIQCPDEKSEWVFAGIQKIVQTIHAKMPGTKLLLLGIFPARNPADHPARARIAEVNRLISKLDDGNKTRFLNIGKIFLSPDGTVDKDLMPDALHPNDKGYQLWLDTMMPVLSEMLK